MKQYDSYKDSGVEWIGEVPSHWEIVPLKFTGTFGNGLTYSPKDVVDNGILVLRSSNIQNSELSFEDNVFVSNVSKDLMVNKGDIIICSRNGSAALVGKSAFIDKDIKATFGAFMMRYIPRINKKYGFYLFQTAIGRYKGYFATTTINQLTKSTIGEMKVPMANVEEQNVIASYLDKKCSEIDKVISAQQKRIALLQELRQSVITHAVTKGLNPNVEMKDSGMEWIGKVPSHWNNLRLRFVCELRNGYTPSKANPDFWEDGNIPWYRMEDIRESGRKLKEAKQYITEEAVKGGGLFEAGSFILATTATIGEHAVLIVDSLANQQFTNLKIRKSLSQRLLGDYFFYYLYMVDDYCKATTKTSTFPAVSMELLKNCHVVFPTIKEQYKIIEYLDRKCASIDSSISKAQHQVELLQEYKQSLITEVVTGKRKVC